MPNCGPRSKPRGRLFSAHSSTRSRLVSPRCRRPSLPFPRMADFALWATACETALWPAGTFQQAYGENLGAAVESVIEADPVATAVRTFFKTGTVGTVWTGKASDLLGALESVAGERATKSKTWPD